MTHPLIAELKKLQISLETQKLGKRFDLKKAGSADGTQNRPEPVSTTMSPTEIELHAHVNEIVSTAYGKVVEVQQSINADLDVLKADLNVEQDIASIKDSFNHLSPKVRVATDQHKGLVKAAAEHFGSLTRSFKKFKSDNNLESKVPNYPEDRFKHSRLIFFGAALEFLLAFPFYFEVSGTPVAAFGFAFLVVILNILPIFIFGNLFRFVNHVSPTKKFGYVSFAVLCFLLFLTAILLAGHLRTAIGEVVERLAAGAIDDLSLMTQAGKIAFSTFINSPLSLGGDVLAIMFMIASFAFGIFTAWKAYTIDDEYPGYGPLDRQRRAAEADLNSEKARIFLALDNVYRESSEVTKKVFSEARARCSSIVYQIAEFQNITEAYSLFYDQANANLKAAVQIYRAANIYVRSEPPPDYFIEDLTVDGLSPDTLDSLRQQDLELASTLEKTVELLVGVYNETQKKLKDDQRLRYDQLSSELEEVVRSAGQGA